MATTMFIDWLTLIPAGFSLICGWVLLAAYAWSDSFPKKTTYSVCAAAALTLVLAILQWQHLQFVFLKSNPLESWWYLIPLFLGPLTFFLFGRAVVMPDAPVRPWLALHALPVLLPFIAPRSFALPVLFGVGCGYAIWFSSLVYRARVQRRQRRFEAAFSVLVSVAALAVFSFGVSLHWVEPAYFVAVYALSVGATYAMITFALVGIPDFLRDLFEVTQAKYSVSKLGDVDVIERLEQLEALMRNDKLYQQDDINLAAVAEALEVTPHQLSELINTQLGIGFSRYVRSKRLDAACTLLRANPEQSVLSIALEVGFRSQSTFYAAFKSDFQQSPSDYRAGK